MKVETKHGGVRPSTGRLALEEVLDPFAGAGTTLVAARNMGRQFIGVAKEAGYWQVAVDSLTA